MADNLLLFLALFSFGFLSGFWTCSLVWISRFERWFEGSGER